MIKMSMEQEGTENKLDLEEGGNLITGGSFSETLDKTETVAFGAGMMLTETPSMSETVVITNV